MQIWWRSLLSLPLALACSGLSPAASAADGTGTIAGALRLDGAPVVGAQVVVASEAVSSFQGEGRSDAQGGFEIGDVPLGRFTIRVYDAGGAPILVGEGEIAAPGDRVVVDLHPPGDGA